MLIQVNTDSNIEGGEGTAERAQVIVGDAVGHFSEQITRIEVHLSDENSNKKPGADDMRCVLEARLAGLKPIAVHHQAATLEQAIEGASEKLKRSLESVLGRLESR
jgi:ribosome-associated translation inhibitor RaiA